MSDKPSPKKVTLSAQDIKNANEHLLSQPRAVREFKKESKYDEGLLPGMDQEAHRALMQKTERDDQLSSGLIVLGCIVGAYLIYRLLLAIKRSLLSAKEINVSVAVKISDKQKTS